MVTSCSGNLDRISADVEVGDLRSDVSRMVINYSELNNQIEFSESADEIIITDNDSYSLEQMIIIFNNDKVSRIIRKDSGTR